MGTSAHSDDLRARVVGEVLSGASRRQAAARFKVSVSSAIRWTRLQAQTGGVSPRARGGRSRSPLEPHADWLLALLVAEPDLTLQEIVERVLAGLGSAELHEHLGGNTVWKANPYPISTFRQIVEQVARLAYNNWDQLLFFRGQNKVYQNKAGGSTLYPSIYRRDTISSRELQHRFQKLEQAGAKLVERWRVSGLDGLRDIRQKRYIQWSILQHYEVLDTPLLDIAHSLRVACSFAQQDATDDTCFVYVVGLPQVTNRISINSEHDLVNIRLLSICPPSALRPHFQEGYLAGTTDVTWDFESKTELDFRNRLIAKFEIPISTKFWGDGFNRIPKASLYPSRDKVLRLCSELREDLRDELMPGDLGAFMVDWSVIEERLTWEARNLTGRNVSPREAICDLLKRGRVPEELASELRGLREFRNFLVHEPSRVDTVTIGSWLPRVRAASALIKNLLSPSPTSMSR